MFRISFDRYMSENVKEHFFVCVHAYAGIEMHTQAPFMRRCSSIYTNV